MPVFQDITGQKFRNLTALRRVENYGKYTRWEFLCDCGNIFANQVRHVKKQKVTNCGCIKENKKYNIRGKRFGKLLALEITDKKRGRNFIWECLCDCGNKTYVSRPDLTTGNTKSCGCLRIENLSKARKAQEKDFYPSKTAEYKRNHQRKRLLEPKYRIHGRISANMRIALKKQKVSKENPTFMMLGYSLENLMTHLEKQFSKGMSWNNIGKWHIDHIIPMDSASTLEDVIRLNHFSNLRPLWAKENLSKGKNRTHLI
jgi:hypothetical protein